MVNTLHSFTVDALDRLRAELLNYPTLTIAVSGGVDSMTLAFVALETMPESVHIVHAVSPAVPLESTDRVKRYADQFKWQLTIIDAGEFADERYRENPVNRCYFCKTNLYSQIRQRCSGVIASGANLDDLGDYRPGLTAAAEHEVIHPLINAGITKDFVRSIAKGYQLEDIAELPAQPCLSSRVETGIAIKPDDLGFIYRIERYLTDQLGAGDIRCRVTAKGVRIELEQALVEANLHEWEELKQALVAMIQSEGRRFDQFTSYQKGSAFLTSSN